MQRPGHGKPNHGTTEGYDSTIVPDFPYHHFGRSRYRCLRRGALRATACLPLTGRVTSEKEGPMEGVVVTARKDSDRVMGLNTSSREVTEYLLPSPTNARRGDVVNSAN
jgi:hypothetical protein